MRVRAALSIAREEILKLQFEGFKKLIQGVLHVSRLSGIDKVHKGFTAYLQSEGIHPNDESILAWLQENPGELIAAYILETDSGAIDFKIATGTQAELRQIGVNHVEKSNGPQRTTRVRQVNVGQGQGFIQPG